MESVDITYKILEFFKAGMQYYGKEIALSSYQYFGINHIKDEVDDDDFHFTMQYGYPQSGSIFISFRLPKGTNNLLIDSVDIYALDENEKFTLGIYAPELQVGETNMSFHFGLDMHTTHYSSIDEIGDNPNAYHLIEYALKDLIDAEILGECTDEVPDDSTIIPCCSSTMKKKKL